MATYYLDPVNGNDANDGTTFANRWKTFNSGATAARTAPGDTIRIIRNDEVAMGVNCTFTNNSPTLTLASAKNELVTDCDTNWTAATNVTCNQNAQRPSGSFSQQINIGSGFTTGKVAHFPLGATKDFSAYQGLTWWMAGGGWSANTLKICLCSDTTGDVIVDSFMLPASAAILSRWKAFYLDKGSALGSSIQSIALYADLDPGTISVYLDNINTVKAPGADQLHLVMILGKSAADGWYPIRNINGTTVTIDGTPALKQFASTTPAKGYYGTSETVELYKMEPSVVASGTLTVQESGSSGSPITYSGGWDRTNMSTQSGRSWLTCESELFMLGMDLSTKSWIRLEKLGFWRFASAISLTSATDLEFQDIDFVGCSTELAFNATLRVVMDGITSCAANNCFGATITLTGAKVGTYNVRNMGQNTTLSGFIVQMSSNTRIEDLTIDTLTIQGSLTNPFNVDAGGLLRRFRCKNYTAKYCTNTGGLFIQWGWDDYIFGNVTLDSNVYGIGFAGGYGVIKNLVTANSSSNEGVRIGTIAGYPSAGLHRILASSIGESTKVQANVFQVADGWVFFENFNGTSNDHRGYYDGSGAKMFAETGADRHTGSGLGWSIDCLSTAYSSEFPIRFKLADLMLTPSVAATISLYVKRSNSSTINARLVVPGGYTPGISTDQVDTAAAGSGTWEQLSVSVTPTGKEVVEVFLEVWGGTTETVFFDDFGVA